MPRFTQLNATGEGSALIDSGTPQSPIQVDLANIRITQPRVKETYVSLPKFEQFAGQVMLGNPDSLDPTIIEAFPIRWKPHQQYALTQVIYVTGVFWKIPTLVLVDITISW